jgi:5-methylcytosine-specific restriction endonuclease McrA
VTRSGLALQLRISLLEVLAPDRRCAHCGRFLVLEDAEIDHAHGRTWCGRRLNFLDRVRRQWQEWRDGIELRAAHRACNASDGARLRGKRRYAVAYR